MPDKSFDPIVKNAFTFLRHSVRDIGNRPSSMVIGVYSAIELILKARIVHDHWALVVNRDADREKYEAGDFVSVNFEEACTRLKKITRAPVPEEYRLSFDRLRVVRNQLVHFYSMDDARPVNEAGVKAEKELRDLGGSAWSNLHRLLRHEWSMPFQEYVAYIDSIEENAIPVFLRFNFNFTSK